MIELRACRHGGAEKRHAVVVQGGAPLAEGGVDGVEDVVVGGVFVIVIWNWGDRGVGGDVFGGCGEGRRGVRKEGDREDREDVWDVHLEEVSLSLAMVRSEQSVKADRSSGVGRNITKRGLPC
jgi:hypothetical protein